jgi:hypothetical protein
VRLHEYVPNGTPVQVLSGLPATLSWPLSLLPHAQTVPSARRPSAWRLPAATLVKSETLVCVATNVALSVAALLPSSPAVPCPQATARRVGPAADANPPT